MRRRRFPPAPKCAFTCCIYASDRLRNRIDFWIPLRKEGGTNTLMHLLSLCGKRRIQEVKQGRNRVGRRRSGIHGCERRSNTNSWKWIHKQMDKETCKRTCEQGGQNKHEQMWSIHKQIACKCSDGHKCRWAQYSFKNPESERICFKLVSRAKSSPVNNCC